MRALSRQPKKRKRGISKLPKNSKKRTYTHYFNNTVLLQGLRNNIKCCLDCHSSRSVSAAYQSQIKKYHFEVYQNIGLQKNYYTFLKAFFGLLRKHVIRRICAGTVHNKISWIVEIFSSPKKTGHRSRDESDEFRKRQNLDMTGSGSATLKIIKQAESGI